MSDGRLMTIMMMSILAKATGTHYGTKTPSASHSEAARRETRVVG